MKHAFCELLSVSVSDSWTVVPDEPVKLKVVVNWKAPQATLKSTPT
jgi:hypothetical protein